MTVYPLRNPTSPRSAFTLLELIVSFSLFLVISGILVSVLGSVTNLSSQATAKLEATRMAREIFDVIQRDLNQVINTRPSLSPKAISGATPAPSPETALNSALQFCVNPPALSADLQNPTGLFCQSLISRDRSSGNLAVVGYFVQKSGTNRSQLRRVLIEPNDPLYTIYTSPSNWLPSATLAEFKMPSDPSATTNADRGWFADGVLGFWVRCLDQNGEVVTKDGAGNAFKSNGYAFDSRLGFQSGSSAEPLVLSSVNAQPAFVDVGIVCIAAGDSKLITSQTPVTTTSPANFEQDIAAYLAKFQGENRRVKTALSLVRRIPIRGGY